MKRIIFLASIVFAAWCAQAVADIVYLDDGRKYEGTVSEDGDVVKVKTRMGELSFPKNKVERIEKVKSSAAVYKDKLAALKDDDVDGHYKLALWCRDQHLIKEMTAELEKVVALSPDHEGARAALNHVKIDGEWVKARSGMVYVDGKWVKPEDALEKGKSLYKVEKYEEAFRVLDGAVRNLKKDCDVADAQYNLGMTAERLGKWDDAKAAYGAILDMKTTVDQKPAAEARKSVIDSSAGGMFLVKEPTGKDDIFSLDNEQKEKIKKLAGLQPLSNPEVMDIALRERCIIYIEKGKDYLKQAKDANTGSAEGDKKSVELLDKAEDQFRSADRTVKDLARGFLVECTKLRIEVYSKPFNIRWAKLQGSISRINTVEDPKEKIATAKGILKEIDDLAKSLDVIQKLAGQYPDELSQQVAQGKNIRNAITQLKATLSGFVGN